MRLKAVGRSMLLAAAILVLMTPAARGATHDVDVGPGFSFIPADLKIDVGDTVRWTWKGGSHNVESGVNGNHDGNFRSGPPTSVTGTTFEVTFDQTFLDDHPMTDNVYPYYCIVHIGVGMTGTITVNIPCPADLTDDSTVDVFDLFELLNAWGTNGAGADLAAPTDTVDVFDLFVLLNAWGGC